MGDGHASLQEVSVGSDESKETEKAQKYKLQRYNQNARTITIQLKTRKISQRV